jgi:hypothetical protein
LLQKASLIDIRERLNRLLLALFIAMWWDIHLATSSIHHGLRYYFDLHDRRGQPSISLGLSVVEVYFLASLELSSTHAALAVSQNSHRVEVRFALLTSA